MQDLIVSRLLERFASYEDLAALLDDNLLNQKVDVPRHKSLAEHLWCVIGARESYAKAIEQGSWMGFSCSMQSFSAEDFRSQLEASAAAVKRTLESVPDWSEARAELLALLSEHEVMHEGQIIRHMYALERKLPDSWQWA